MCAIAGVVNMTGAPRQTLEAAVAQMTSRMARRGPDAEGAWADERVVLGHRRLAILDLDPRSNQPMISADGRYHIVFNGEIYNFSELRRDLVSEGETFRTSSDTEVLLSLYAHERERMLPRLRGMFAFGIWDNVAGELFLARDAYGIKPLYYARTGSGFAFASQVKALQASGLIAKVLEPAAVAAFYLWGSISEPWTVNRDVFALPAGHWLRVRDGTSDAPVRWTDIADGWIPSTHRCDGDLAEHVRTSVTDSIRAHLVSDVPVCIFLSAGIDSAVLAGLTAQLGANVEAVTVGFDEFVGRSEDEVPVAVAAAAHYGLPHTVRRVSVAEFEADVPKVLEAMDQPSVDGINTWFASKAAAERGFKVALSGIGGDELFCGYSSFRQVPQAAAAARVLSLIPGGRALLQAGCDQLAKNPRRAKMAALPQMMSSVEGLYFLRRALFIPQELPALMGVEGARAALERLGTVWGPQRDLPRHAVSAVARLESTQYLRNQLLRDSDWSSMAHSLELRTPLVDHTLLRALGPFVSRFVGGSGKRLLAEVPVKPLPDTILHRRKTGFALPMAEWLRNTHSGSAPWARTWAASVLKAAACG